MVIVFPLFYLEFTSTGLDRSDFTFIETRLSLLLVVVLDKKFSSLN